MKFINYLSGITGIGIFPLVSLGIFFIFFLALLFYVIRADRKHIAHLEQIPLN